MRGYDDIDVANTTEWSQTFQIVVNLEGGACRPISELKSEAQSGMVSKSIKIETAEVDLTTCQAPDTKEGPEKLVAPTG